MWTEQNRPAIGQQYESAEGVIIEIRAIWVGGVVCCGKRVFQVDTFLKLFKLHLRFGAVPPDDLLPCPPG